MNEADIARRAKAESMLLDYYETRERYIATARRIYAHTGSLDAAIHIDHELDEATEAHNTVIELIVFGLKYKEWLETMP